MRLRSFIILIRQFIEQYFMQL